MHIVGLAFVITAMALYVGAILQGCIGFGMVVLAFPVLVTIEPALMPGSMLIASLPIITVNLFRNWGGTDLREVGWLTLGRLPGIALAIWLVGAVDSSLLSLGGGVLVLGAVALSFWAPRVVRSRRNLVSAGVVAGVFGTALGMGGPPIGLLYQHEDGPRLRATVSVMMFAGAPLSLAMLALSGDLTATDLRTGLALMPVTTLGIFSAPRFIGWFDQRMRVAVLAICAIAAVVAMAKIVISG